MPVRTYNLQIDQGASFSAVLVWIAGGQGVNPAGSTSAAIFRQVPGDTPLVSISTTPNTSGSIVYLPSVPNFPYIPPNSAPDVQPALITLYPMQVNLFAAGVALLVFPSARWRWDISWPDGSITPFVAGDVEMVNV